jgi:hypothetical protein
MEVSFMDAQVSLHAKAQDLNNLLFVLRKFRVFY